jgi:hypothetical protein
MGNEGDEKLSQTSTTCHPMDRHEESDEMSGNKKNGDLD